jgi:hypothetical protein
MEGKAQEPALVKLSHEWDDLGAQIEEGFGKQRPVGRHDADQSDLIEDEQAAGLVRRRDDPDGRCEPVRDKPESDVSRVAEARLGLRRTQRRSGQDRGDQQ